MILKVFAVRDMKAQAFLQPFYSPSLGSALRAFGDAVGDVSCPFSKHPEDYVLYEIGAYDDNSGDLESLSPVKLLGCASDFVRVVPPVSMLPAADLVEAVVGNGKKPS